MLGAVEAIAFIFFGRARADGGGVRSGIGFGQAERADATAIQQAGQKFLDLRLAAIFDQPRDNQTVLDADDGGKRAIGSGQLDQGDGIRDHVGARAAQFFGHRHAHQSHLRQFLEQGRRITFGGFEGARLGPDALLGEAAHGVLDGLLGFIEQHGMSSNSEAVGHK